MVDIFFLSAKGAKMLKESYLLGRTRGMTAFRMHPMALYSAVYVTALWRAVTLLRTDRSGHLHLISAVNKPNFELENLPHPDEVLKFHLFIKLLTFTARISPCTYSTGYDSLMAH